MRSHRNHRHARFPQRHLTRAVDDRQAADAEPALDLVGDQLEHRAGHRLVGFVFEPFDRASGMARGLVLLAGRRHPRCLPGATDEPDHGAVCRRGQTLTELGQDPQVERLGSQLQDAHGFLAAIAPAADGRDHRQLIAVRKRLRGLNVFAVPREPHGGAARGKDRKLGDQRSPGVVDACPGRQLESGLTHTSELALDGEQPNADVDPSRDRLLSHARYVATSRPSPTGRMEATNRGSDSNPPLNWRKASVSSVGSS